MSLIDAIKKPLIDAAPDGVPDDADMALINARAAVPLAPENIFVYPQVVANRNMSSHGTHMSDSTLARFAVDAQNGAPQNIQHNREMRVLGTMYAGHYDAQSGESRASVFLVRGRTINTANGTISINQEIQDIQHGIRRYVSVGLGGANMEFICDICGKDMFGWYGDESPCIHIPLVKYAGVLATCRVDGAEMVECSNVDKGAIPGAVIGRAAKETDTGQAFVLPANYAARHENAIIKGNSFFPVDKFAKKALHCYRTNNLSEGAMREWMDVQQVSDETRTTFTAGARADTPAQSSKKDQIPMDWKEFAASLAGLGLSIPTLPENATPKDYAAAIATVYKQNAQTPQTTAILAVFVDAGITTPEKAREYAISAANGKLYETRVEKELAAECNRKWGATEGPERFKKFALVPLETKQMFIDDYRKENDKEYKFDDKGAPVVRESASAELTRHSIGYQEPTQEQKDAEKQRLDKMVEEAEKKAGNTAPAAVQNAAPAPRAPFSK